jgi:type II secretory ATPase GspE/PulE/Tfp pilus assembly ATPase PilB-like protein
MPVHFDEDAQKRRAAEFRLQEAERFAGLVAHNLGLQYADLSLISINPDALGLVDEPVTRAAKLAVFREAGKTIDVAVFSPTLPGVSEILEKLRGEGYVVTLYVTTEESLERAWKYYADLQKIKETKVGQIDISAGSIAQYIEKINTLEDSKHLIMEILKGSGAAKVTAMLEAILASAIALETSDIHLEPEEHNVRARFRFDGVLHEIASFEHHTYRLLLARIKLLSSLKLNVASTRQDGRFSVEFGKNGIDIRASIIPGGYGESVVMRLLNPESVRVPLEKLGMSDQVLKIMQAEIDKPNGMILNTGPTGSGKTTTLYTFLQVANDPGVKIITIEDPIEYQIEGLVQTQVNAEKGYTFFEGLKSAMRQDPDLIMVGEIRDGETANTAIDAALTGHLVFSTLHTNNAAGTIPRLIDLGVNPKVIGPAMNVAMAQRLVRVICQKCKSESAITPEERIIIDKRLVTLAEIDIHPSVPEKISRPVGCPSCNNTGYKGRIGIFEIILVDQSIEEIIANNPSEYEVMQVARKQKIPDMTEDGILKVLDGRTTIEELSRVVDLS